MSLANWRREIRDTLRNEIPLGENECDLTVGPEPFKTAGDIFVSIHYGGWGRSNAGNATWLEEEFSVEMTVSLRGSHIPSDRFSEKLLTADDQGLEFFGDKIIRLIDSDYDLLGRVNSRILKEKSPIVTPMYWQGAAPPAIRPSAWWGIQKTFNEFEGVSQTHRFGGSKRSQDAQDLR